MRQIYPYIKLNDGKCKEAMEFYSKCLDAEITAMMTLGESPMAKEMPPETHNLVMHSTLSKNGMMLFSASDMMRDKATIGDNVGITIDCESEEEIRSIFEKLSQGGEVFMPIEDTFWDALFGMLTDKYGVEWMLNFPKTK